jgi:hypothetical protein
MWSRQVAENPARAEQRSIVKLEEQIERLDAKIAKYRAELQRNPQSTRVALQIRDAQHERASVDTELKRKIRQSLQRRTLDDQKKAAVSQQAHLKEVQRQVADTERCIAQTQRVLARDPTLPVRIAQTKRELDALQDKIDNTLDVDDDPLDEIMRAERLEALQNAPAAVATSSAVVGALTATPATQLAAPTPAATTAAIASSRPVPRFNYE